MKVFTNQVPQPEKTIFGKQCPYFFVLKEQDYLRNVRFARARISPIDIAPRNDLNEAWLNDSGKFTHEGVIPLAKNSLPNFIKLHFLVTKALSSPLDVCVETDGDSFIARTIDVPLYGLGEDIMEAVTNLKHEIESLHLDLMQDDNFTQEWLEMKKFLCRIINDKV